MFSGLWPMREECFPNIFLFDVSKISRKYQANVGMYEWIFLRHRSMRREYWQLQMRHEYWRMLRRHCCQCFFNVIHILNTAEKFLLV
jgi:hypothetical protein